MLILIKRLGCDLREPRFNFSNEIITIIIIIIIIIITIVFFPCGAFEYTYIDIFAL